MTIEQLRRLHQARPFQPFTMYLADGSQISVAHNEFLSHSESGRTVIVHHPGVEDYAVIDLLLVAKIEVHQGGSSAAPKSSDGAAH